MTHNTTRPRIVVGVSHSPAATAALRWALGEAGLRGAEIEPVHAWQWSGQHRASYAPMGTWRSHDEEYAAAREQTRRVVGHVAPCLEPIVTHGPPAQVLLTHCEGAEMLVLGIRNPEPGTPVAATPVVVACIMSAPCPVVVVSPRSIALRPVPAHAGGLTAAPAR
ncbi:universal stress protein [Sphaerisporangium melleum]|uniref:Universal stress protein n=1 Tax=Sphaerisporangium melleum TaxID=321316 RepID=A0A917VQI8_9ACTN|nr:universal stress protein [Sphaerisporangium melleum]GGL07897.1 universal stress protein [Sphaerisporangium melleum]GII74283.1 universal stress protein [Sphaerisporangium melleum]